MLYNFVKVDWDKVGQNTTEVDFCCLFLETVLINMNLFPMHPFSIPWKPSDGREKVHWEQMG